MNSRFLETFLWVSRFKSFSRTAERMHATQPAISNRVAKLEELLGVSLYNKNAKEFELTAAGHRILPFAEAILKLTSQLVEAAHVDDEMQGDLRVGIVEMAMISWLPTYIRILEGEFPNLRITFTSDTTGRLVEALDNDEIDLAIIMGAMNSPGISSLSVGICPLSWLASPKVFDLNKEIDVVELSRQPIIASRKDSSAYQVLADYFNSNGADNVRDLGRTVVVANAYSGSSSLHLVKEGLGVAALPPIMCVREIGEGVVGPLKVTQALPSFHLTACYKSPTRSRVIPILAETARRAAEDFAATSNPEHFRV